MAGAYGVTSWVAGLSATLGAAVFLTAIHAGLGAVFKDAFGAYQCATYGRDVTEKALRTIEDIRKTILSMPFAQSMQLSIDQAGDGVGVASMPLSDAVSFDGAAFAALAIGTVADIAAGAATLAMTPPDQMAYTSGIDSTITAKTQGTRLSARASLRERHGQRLIFDALVWTHPSDGDPRQCGEATVTMHITRAVTP